MSGPEAGPERGTPTDSASERRWVEWAARECRRRAIEEDPDRIEEILPPERFPAETGTFGGPYTAALQKQYPAGATAALIADACCGWRRRPTTAEAVRAIRGRRRGPFEDCIVETMITESNIDVLMLAEITGEYSLRDIAWWIRELEIPCQERIQWLNAWATPQ